jgi:membrane fusion protein, heavy metal efflux system
MRMRLVLLAATLLLYACSKSSRAASTSITASIDSQSTGVVGSGNTIKFAAKSPQLSRIQTALVEDAQVPVDELAVPGKVEMNPGRVSHVALPVAGRIREVVVGIGEAVIQGQTLLIMESPEVFSTQSALRQAEANVSQAMALVAKSETDLARAQDLFTNKAIAQKDVLAAQMTLLQSKASLDLATASGDEAARKLRLLGVTRGDEKQLVEVRAPISGKVMDISIASGEYRNDTSAPVLTIADLTTIWISADVPETSIRLIRLGEPVSISLPAYPDHEFHGTVKRIGDLVDPQTRTIKVRAELGNPSGRLRPEMFATIRYSLGFTAALVIPKPALFQQQDRTTVFLERGPAEFEEVPVTICWQNDTHAAVQGGLHRGDRVVVDGVAQLRAYLGKARR